METLASITREVDWIPSSVVLNAFPNGVAICDEQGVIYQVNDELTRLFGYAEHELIGESVERLIPDGLKDKYQSQLLAAIDNPAKSGTGMVRDLGGLRKDDSSFPVEVGLSPIDTPFGCRIITTFTDVTPRHNAIASLKKIIDSAPVAMLITDQQGEIKHANKQLYCTFGYEPGSLQGEAMSQLVPLPNQIHQQQYGRHCQHSSVIRETGVEMSLVGLHQNGRTLPLEIGLNPVEMEGESLIVVTMRDVTLSTLREENLLRQQHGQAQLAQQVVNKLEEPLYNIHERLRTFAEAIGDHPQTEMGAALQGINGEIKVIEQSLEELRKQGGPASVPSTQAAFDGLLD